MAQKRLRCAAARITTSTEVHNRTQRCVLFVIRFPGKGCLYNGLDCGGTAHH
jgi:hypothetical protein